MKTVLCAASAVALLSLASPASAAFVFNTGELGGTPVNIVDDDPSTTQIGTFGGKTVTFTSTNTLETNNGAAAILSDPLTNLNVSFEVGYSEVGWNVELTDTSGGGGPDASAMTVSINGGSTLGVDFFTVDPLAPPQKYNITTTDGSLINMLDFTFDPGVGATKQFRLTLGDDGGGGGGSGGPIPEPATWAMMILGFFGLGAMLRRQRRLTPMFV